MAKKFPKTIYVVRESEGTNDEYLRVSDDGVDDSDFAETTPVAMYSLVEVGQVTVSRQYEKTRNG